MLGKLRSLVEEENEVELYISCYTMPYDRYNALFDPDSAGTSTSVYDEKEVGSNAACKSHNVVKQFALFDCLSIDAMRKSYI